MDELINLLDTNCGYVDEIRVSDLAEKILSAGYAKVVRCRECKYAPEGTEGFDLEWPYTNVEGFDTNPCPLKCSDPWYSHKPKPDFFCAHGEQKED